MPHEPQRGGRARGRGARSSNEGSVRHDGLQVIGLVFLFTRMTINLVVGGTIVAVALMWWMVVAMMLVLPGDKRATRRSMRSASRMMSRAVRRMLPIL